MKKILIISFYFPPTGGGGVQRILKFVKYLPEFGVTSIVAASKGIKNYTKDESLLKEIPENTEVIYLPTYSLLNLKNKSKKSLINKALSLINLFIICEGLFSWYFLNRKKVFSTIKEKNIDTILTTSPSNATHLFGLYLKKKIKNIKWIADFRDEWTKNPERINNKRILKNNFIIKLIEKKIEKEVFKKSDKIIFVSPPIVEKYMKALSPKKIEIITNGYDEEDFTEINKNLKSDKNTFKILYYGSLYGALKPYNFIRAFNEFVQNDNKKVKVDFIGKIEKLDEIKKMLNEKKIEEFFTFKENIEHKKLLEKANQYDLLLLFVSWPYKDVIPAKTFEYMRLDVPILAMTPPDSISGEIIKKSKTGAEVNYDNINKIKNALSIFYNKWKAGLLLSEYKKNKNWKMVEKYERKNLTKKLANLIMSL